MNAADVTEFVLDLFMLFAVAPLREIGMHEALPYLLLLILLTEEDIVAWCNDTLTRSALEYVWFFFVVSLKEGSLISEHACRITQLASDLADGVALCHLVRFHFPDAFSQASIIARPQSRYCLCSLFIDAVDVFFCLFLRCYSL